MELFNYPLMNISDTSFKDINSENWFYNYVGTAKELGFIQGYEDGSFKPNQSITRSEALKILLKASLKNIDTTNPADFNDVNQDQWYAPYVNWAFEKELVSGYEFGPEKGLFGPGNTITRAEISKIADLLNLLETTEITK